ncbi:hypothetical protein RKD21_005131 [Streptomyces albogriseolus]|uniref:Uncharacterized protein n=1 Tax=Streptomyces albogriseolus TaxID=1887 RepID=A0ACC6UUF6_STRAO
MVVTATKFEEGAWLIVVALPLLVFAFRTVQRAYARIGQSLGLGRIPDAPHLSPPPPPSAARSAR